MRSFLNLIAIILVSAVTAFFIINHNDSNQTAKATDALTRVQSTQTLRCGYVDYEPANFRDPQTGKMQGILVDVAEVMAARMGVKLEWVIAGGWASFITDMQAGKFDAFCGAAWGLQPAEIMGTSTSAPIYYSVISAWTRADSTRFDANLSNVDDPSVTIAATDGSFPMVLAQTRFPKAKILSLPETASYALNLTNVADGKADIGFVEEYISSKYDMANPGKIKKVGGPVYISGNMFSTLKGDTPLLNAMEMALAPLFLNGEIDAIIRKYEPAPDTFMRRNTAYTRSL